MTEELISIIIPVYGVEDYLGECVDSVLAQSYPKLEILLIDDGSPDRCGEICDQYAEAHSQIRVIHQKNGGLSDARNAGLEKAAGRYISFIDSDDIVDSNYIMHLYEALKHNDADISQCMFTSRREDLGACDEQVELCMSGEEAFRKLLLMQRIGVSSCAKLISQDLFQQVRFPIGRINEDTCTTYKLLYEAKKVVCISQRLYYYRIRQGSIMHCGLRPKQLDILSVPYEMKKYLKERADLYSEELDYYRMRLTIHLYHQLLTGTDWKEMVEEKENIRKQLCELKKGNPYFSKKYEILLTVLRMNAGIYALLVRLFIKGSSS